MVLAREAVGLEQRGPVRAVLLGDAEVEARAVVVASGVSYRRLVAEGVDELTGRGIYYGASASDAAQLEGQVVHVVGAANSAGQAVPPAPAGRCRGRRTGWSRACPASSPPATCGRTR